MELHIIASGSSGNCYVLKNETSALIIEAGVRFQTILETLQFDVSNIIGCLVSHAHLDHSKYVKEYASRGVKIYCNKDVLEKNFCKHSYNFLNIGYDKKFVIGDYSIKPISLNHDVPCLGFYINHKETGNFCFITDTNEVPFRFGKLNNIMIECNYDRTLIDTNETPYFLRDRVVNSHLSVQGVVEFLEWQDLSETNQIVLLHTSIVNSDVKKFKEIIASEIGKPVIIAKKNLIIDFNKNPF